MRPTLPFLLKSAAMTLLVAAVLWPVAAPTLAASLASSQWHLVEIDGAAAANGETLSFAADKVSGKAACNRFFGSYSLDGTKLSFGGLGATRMFCEGKMDAEQKLLEALGKVQSIKRDDAAQRLTLVDAGGKTVLVLAPQ